MKCPDCGKLRHTGGCKEASDEVEQFWDDRLTSRAFNDGKASRGTNAQNPYVDPSAKAAWDQGHNS